MHHIKQVILSEVIVGEQIALTITEFQDKYDIDEEFFNEMLEHGLLPENKSESENIYLDLHSLRHVMTALRLQRDLEINMPGIALILDLRDQLEAVRKERDVLRKHLGT